jgi:hypothetical protein
MRYSMGRAFLVVFLGLSLPVASLPVDAGASDAAPALKQLATGVKSTKQPASGKRTASKAASAKQAGTKAAPAKVVAGKAAPAKQAAKQTAPKVTAPKLSAAEILQRHLAARGGAKAWNGVQAMAWNGKIELGYADSVARAEKYVRSSMGPKGKGPVTQPPEADGPRQQVQAPFALELKRPEKSRMELQFAGKTAVQVYDGRSGWLLRPYLNREDWEPFTADQAKAQQGQFELGGPLVDAAAKGTKVALVSVEAVDGKAAYKLKLSKKGGETQLVWVDAKTFLDVKVEGAPRRMDGKMHPVFVTQRDFRAVQGLVVPFSMETAVDGYADTHKMTIERVLVNPKLDDNRFTKPKA